MRLSWCSCRARRRSSCFPPDAASFDTLDPIAEERGYFWEADLQRYPRYADLALLASPTPIVPRTFYGIAFVAPQQGGGTKLPFRIQGTGAAGGLSLTSESMTLSTLPATWTTGASFSDGPPSAFVR